MKLLVAIVFFLANCNTFTYAKNFYPITKGKERRKILNTIAEAEVYYDLPTGLLRAIVSVESAFYPLAFNSHTNPGVAVSSYGLGQLTSDTAWSHCGLSGRAVYDVFKNVYCSAKVLKYYLIRNRKHVNRAIASYNWGTPCECNGDYYQRLNSSRTPCRRGRKPIKCKASGTFLNQDYVDKVFNRFIRFHGIGQASSSEEADQEDEISYYANDKKKLKKTKKRKPALTLLKKSY